MARRGENIYHRKDGRWEGRYWIGTGPDGRWGGVCTPARTEQTTLETYPQNRICTEQNLDFQPPATEIPCSQARLPCGKLC